MVASRKDLVAEFVVEFVASEHRRTKGAVWIDVPKTGKPREFAYFPRRFKEAFPELDPGEEISRLIKAGVIWRRWSETGDSQAIYLSEEIAQELAGKSPTPIPAVAPSEPSDDTRDRWEFTIDKAGVMEIFAVEKRTTTKIALIKTDERRFAVYFPEGLADPNIIRRLKSVCGQVQRNVISTKAAYAQSGRRLDSGTVYAQAAFNARLWPSKFAGTLGPANTD